MGDSQSPLLLNLGYHDTLAEPTETEHGTRDYLKAYENLRDQRYEGQIVPSTSTIFRQSDGTVHVEPLDNYRSVRA
jgi:hypothetical protein